MNLPLIFVDLNYDKYWLDSGDKVKCTLIDPKSATIQSPQRSNGFRSNGFSIERRKFERRSSSTDALPLYHSTWIALVYFWKLKEDIKVKSDKHAIQLF